MPAQGAHIMTTRKSNLDKAQALLDAVGELDPKDPQAPKTLEGLVLTSIAFSLAHLADKAHW
jgi:hypothetical protein